VNKDSANLANQNAKTGVVVLNSVEVYKLVQKIPRGKVMTYGQVAKLTGLSPRQVGRILHLNPDPTKTPCHRVVNVKGEVSKSYAFGGAEIQSKKLAQEGVEFLDNNVNIEKCLHKR